MSEYDRLKEEKMRLDQAARRMVLVDLVNKATQFAREQQQTTGEKGDYYITLEQLNEMAMARIE